MTYEQPNQTNISIDDSLLYDHEGVLKLKISEIRELGVSAGDDTFKCLCCPYKDAVILKKNNTLLVGKSVPESNIKKILDFIIW